MKQQITEKIIEWVGENKNKLEFKAPRIICLPPDSTKVQVAIPDNRDIGYAAALATLHSKAPDLAQSIIDMIVKEIKHKGLHLGYQNDIINQLTKE